MDKLIAAIYHATRAANNLTLQHTIAAALTGVSIEDVTNITVTAIPAPLTAHTSMRGFLNSAEEGCVVRYQIALPRSEVHTFDSLTAELVAAAQSGRMDELLHQFASVFNTNDAFEDCSFGVPIVTYLRTEAPSVAPTVVPVLIGTESTITEELSDGAVVGIVLGCVSFVGIALFILFYYRRRVYMKRYQPTEAQVVPIDDEAEQAMVTV